MQQIEGKSGIFSAIDRKCSAKEIPQPFRVKNIREYAQMQKGMGRSMYGLTQLLQQPNHVPGKEQIT
ncbi:hypothetical protein SRHO_G00289900 [Serrasalmus rhombeus]